MAKRQDRVELQGSARPAMPGAKDTGPADPTQHIEVSVLLRRGSEPGEFRSATELSARPPQQRKYLTREEFAGSHGASTADLKKIRAFAKKYRLQVVSEDRASRMVKLNGTVEDFSSAFGVDLRRLRHGSGTYRCRTGNLTIPASLGSIIEGVFGLDNRPQAKAHFRVRKEE